MNDNSIYSPPFPRKNTSPSLLFNSLLELYDWVADQRDWANIEAERLGAPDTPFVPLLVPRPNSVERYLNLSVPDMFLSYTILRAIRERHDEVVRNYETQDEWSSDAAIFHRINLVHAGEALLSQAFLPHETREARAEKQIKSKKKEIISFFQKMFGAENIKIVDAEELDAFDFHFEPPDDVDEDK